MVPSNSLKALSDAEKAKKTNQRSPISRPQRDPAAETMNWEASIMRIAGQYVQRKNKEFFTTISGDSHVCKTPFDQLKPIHLNEMQVPKVHEGRYLVCKVVGEPRAFVSTNVLVQDLNDDVEQLKIYNYSYDILNTKWISKGTVLIIKEPHLQFGPDDESVSLRVDSPSDLTFVDPTDLDFLKSLGAEKWHIETRMDPEKIKEEGNQLFKVKNYEAATFLYNRAIRYAPNMAVLYLNRASSQLRSGYFEGAYESAKTALDKGGDREKALFRMGLAAYALRDWKSAVDHFQIVNKEFPDNKDAKIELDKAKQRLKESQTGKYDWEAMHSADEQWRCELDVADYVGPIEIVDVPGKGKGIVATKNISKGTLLLVSKPFTTGYKEDFSVNLLCSSDITMNVNSDATKLLVLRTIEQVRKNPSKAKELYKLYAGDLSRDEVIPEGIVDTARIEHISVLNSFVIEDKNECDEAELMRKRACGLYLAPSFFNHACMATAVRSRFGNVIVFHATRNLKKGEEITFAYVAVTKPYQERTRKLNNWGITCQCRLCELDAKDDNCAERFELLTEFLEITKVSQESPKKIAAKGRKMLEQMRKLYRNRTDVKIDLVQMLEIVGSLHLRAGENEAAIKMWEEMISLVDGQLELAVELPSNLLFLAIVYMRNGKHKKAVELVKKAYKMSVCKDAEHFKVAYPQTSNIPHLDLILSGA